MTGWRRWAALALAVSLVGCGTTAAPPDLMQGNRPLLRLEPLGQPRATVIALHGYNDHKGAFLPFGAAAAEAGIRVVAYDQSGFGANLNQGFWGGDEVLVQDLFAKIEHARRLAPDAPVFVLGESMGASVAMLALARDDAPEVDGLILAAPGVWAGDTLNPWFRRALGVVAGIAPDADLARGRPRDVQASDNIPMLIALGRSRYYTRTARAAALYGLIRLMDQGLEAAPALDVPRLVLIGDHDEVVPDHAYAAFLASLAADDCTLIRYADGWHLLFRDHGRELPIADTLAWIEGREPPSATATCVAPSS
ncbi:MAG: alpha/beta fold hydrolase [Geminicoccaceae bacterium]|nr:MAG: alpha/beta fold hydrolase [Geminicoccaceae bacterium]